MIHVVDSWWMLMVVDDTWWSYHFFQQWQYAYVSKPWYTRLAGEWMAIPPNYGSFIGFEPSPYSNHWRVGLPNQRPPGASAGCRLCGTAQMMPWEDSDFVDARILRYFSWLTNAYDILLTLDVCLAVTPALLLSVALHLSSRNWFMGNFGEFQSE